MARKLVYYADLRARWNITYSRVHLRRLMNKGKFVKAIKLGNGRLHPFTGHHHHARAGCVH